MVNKNPTLGGPILALDSSTMIPSVAIVNKGLILVQEALEARKAHHFSRVIQHCLSRVRLDQKNLVAIGVCRGPGSYTGIRVGLATGLGYARALGIPVLGVDSLAAAALIAHGSGPWLPIHSFRDGSCIGSLFQKESGRHERIWGPIGGSREELISRAPQTAITLDLANLNHDDLGEFLSVGVARAVEQGHTQEALPFYGQAPGPSKKLESVGR